jgi:amino acid adenylation domain-containing protein
VNDLERRIAELSPEKREILLMRFKKEPKTGVESDAIPARAKSDRVALSFAQQRLWFLDQLEPNNPFYNVPITAKLNGSLDIRALSFSCRQIVRVHETLRTSFKIVDGQPAQVILPPYAPLLSIIDLQGLDHFERNTEVHRICLAEVRRPFDLAQDQLLRITVVRLADEEHLLALTMHHIISDGWSKGILLRDLAQAYEGCLRSEAAPLAELPIQYADYAQWQRQRMQGEELDQQLSYWRKQLAGAPGMLELPTDYPRPASRSYQGGRLHFTLSREVTLGLKELSRREGVTLFMVLTAALQSLLHRYTQQREVSIGTPVAGRTRRETEGLIGFFVNTLVLRTDFGGEPTFVEVLQRVREVALGAYAHQEVPFEKLVEELEVERSLSHTPLFQVMMALQNMAVATVELADLEVEVLETEHGTTQFDLVMFLMESGEQLVGRLEYSRDLFVEETIRRLLEHFERLLEGVVRNPEERVSRLPLLSASERTELVERWNETEAEYESGATVVAGFERQVEANAAAVAVVSGEAGLRYEELNERANQLGWYLKGQGVGAETVVGVCVERGVEMLAVLLGILKAGGAYLPLDPEYPWERLSYMVADAGVRVVLTERSVRERLSEARASSGVAWIELEEVAAEIEKQRVTNLESEISGRQLAYVIYTSGSTGQPKGVMIEHRALVNFVQTMTDRLGLKPGERILKFASLSFDASIVQIFPALLGGAAVVIEPNVNKLSNHELLNLCERLKLTVLDLPAAHWRQWVEDMTRHDVTLPPTLRVFMTGGETLPGEILVKWSRLVQRPAMFINSYGPTETTVGATVHHTTSTHAADLEMPRVTIGRPLANVKIYLLDDNLEPMPIGVAGELYIGGAGVARGYLNQPDLTAGKFVPNPFAETPGKCLYRTGDLARYLPDGEIDFLGRKDGQVKIRGFRVEFAEIETSFRRHPGIQEVVVSLKEYRPGDKRLIAYYVSRTEGGPTLSDLKNQLKETLPDYMIPSTFVRLDAMPLTASAKIDRRALLEMEPDDELAESSTGAARTPTEEILAGQWAEVLDLPRVGVDDDFFDLGGHSLLATQLISRLREAFQVELPLRSLFETPTVAAIAALIDQASTQQLAPISPAPADAELPLSFTQQRFWFLDQLNAGNGAFNTPAAVLLNGALDQKALEQSFNEIVKRHEALRTTFRMAADRIVQVVDSARPLNVSLVDLNALTEDERRAESLRISAAESVQSFDLANGPLFSIMLLRLTEFQHLLTLTIHHIAFDGWSLGVILTDFAHFYTKFVTGTSLELPALPIQYGDYAYWQRQTLTGELWDEHLSYWRRQLEHAPTMLDLPTDRPRAAVQSFRGASKSFALSNSLTEDLRSLSRRESATLFMTVFAAFASMLNRFTGQEDLVVGADIANRTRLETEPLIGCFFNHVVLRADFTGHPTFRELLRRVRQIILGAYAHQDFPFDTLVHALQPERTINTTPLFQVLLVFLNTPFNSIDLPGLTLTPQAVETGLAKFDLTLFLGVGPSGLEGSLEYNSDLFDEATAARLVGNLKSLLEAVVDHPDQELDQLNIGAEDEVLVAGFNEVLE